ncbi:MAG: sigma factor, partial [Candidatus Cloacimonadaceae bacterium]|nr:sigma factor [Candidatus Cloacimonadaceae bacterium]
MFNMSALETNDPSYEQLYRKVHSRLGSEAGTRDYATDITNQYMLRKAGKGLSRSSESSEYQTRAAIETYFTELRRYSFSLALRHTGKPDLADEIAQDAMIILLKSNTPKQFIKGWLHKVTLNLIIRNIRDEIR